MKRNYYKCYCENYQDIENYEAAKADNFKGWQCHHRLETHNSDGERRLVDITKKELIALDMYFNRPAKELIFIRTVEHRRLHREGHSHSEDTKQKMSEAWSYNKHFTTETKKNMSQAHKGKKLSEETKRKLSEFWKGKKRGTFSEEERAAWG